MTAALHVYVGLCFKFLISEKKAKKIRLGGKNSVF